MDISPSHTNNTNNLEEEIKEEGDFDVVNMDISPSHTICIKNLNEEFNGEDGQTNQQEKKKKRKRRRRGGKKVNRWRKRLRAMNGLTPLHVCAQENQVSVAAVLVQNGANVNAVSKAGYTPLHVACYYGNTDMVQFLLENGASVNAGVTRQNMAELEGTLFEENCSEFKFISIPYKCAKAGHQKARLQ